MEFLPAGDERDVARVCIIGEPGTGKTRLAGTFPNPLFLDLERGAATAQPGGVHRLVIPTSNRTLDELGMVIDRLNKLPCEDGVINFPIKNGPVIPVQTLVIDTLDVVQQAAKMFDILRGRTRMERNDWDVLLNLMQPLVLKWNSLPINVVVIAHTKTIDGEGRKPGVRGFGVQGSLRTQLPGWFSVIMHLVAGPDGKRFVVTQPMISKGFRYVAKDRHGILADLADEYGIIKVPANEAGYPNDTIAQTICHTNGHKGGKVEAAAEELVEPWAETEEE